MAELHVRDGPVLNPAATFRASWHSSSVARSRDVRATTGPPSTAALLVTKIQSGGSLAQAGDARMASGSDAERMHAELRWSDGDKAIQAVFQARHRQGSPIVFAAFDVLEVDGHSVISEGWTARRKRLEDPLEPPPPSCAVRSAPRHSEG